MKACIFTEQWRGYTPKVLYLIRSSIFPPLTTGDRDGEQLHLYL